MSKWNVTIKNLCEYELVVEAENEEDARELAQLACPVEASRLRKPKVVHKNADYDVDYFVEPALKAKGT